MSTFTKYIAITGVVLGLGMVVGCSDDDTPGKDAGNDSSVSDSGASKTIVDVALEDDELSTLVAALQRADLVDTLNGTGPFTVFAPTNKAFEDSGITDVSAVPVADLTKILLYHVISGAKVMSADVAAGAVESAAELTFFVGTTGGVTLNGGNSVTGGANVTEVDLDADNGVIHKIDRVILPPDVPTCAVYGGLSSLVDAVGAAADLPDGTSVLDALKGDGPFTVFAPTNDAFGDLSGTPSAEELRDVLLYHVVSGSVLSTGIPAKADSLLNNKYDNPITLVFDTSSGVKVNAAMVQLADVKCTNGVVHVIDKVLLPPDVVDMAVIAGLSSLVAAVGAAADISSGTSVEDALRADAPYTVFAPTNAAFDAITVPSDPEDVRDVLLLHVLNTGDPVLSTDLADGQVDSLLSGEKLTIDTSGPSVSSNGTSNAAIGPADFNVTNGVVHVVDKVLVPGT